MRSILPAVLAIILAAGASAAAGAPAPRPTLATEDTMYTELPEVLVTATRITLDQILDRVARGEARRDSAINDQQFQATFRMVRLGGQDKGKDASDELMIETVARVYKKRPHKVRSVTVRQWRAEDQKKKKKRPDAVQVNFRGDMSEEIVNFAFRPEGRRQYRFKIVGRDFEAGRVIYRIAFEPRSPIDLEPSGTVWVETTDFVIVRQEIEFKRSPVPLIIKGVRRLVIERTRADGHWVLSRMLIRAESTIKLPNVGKRFDVSMRFDDYRINRGIADAVFDAGSR